MSEMWYYTTQGKQMDPVTMRELTRLAGEGTLKPTDMVWKDGMDRWVRASTIEELFPAPTAKLDPYFTQPGSAEKTPSAEEPPRRPSVPAGDDDLRPRRRRSRTENDDDGFGGRPRRRPENKSTGSSAGVTIAMVVGAILVLGSLTVGGVILILMSQTSTPVVVGKINPKNLIKGEEKYSVALAPHATDARKFSFRKGVDYEFIVKTETPGKDIDVDLHIFHVNGSEVTKDDDPDRDCYKRWMPDEDGEYRVEIRNVINRGKEELAIRAKVTIREFKEQADVKDPLEEAPLPPGVKEGKGVWDTPTINPGKSHELKLRVKAGHAAQIRATPLGIKADTNIDLEVLKDSDGAMIKSDNGPEPSASVEFSLPATEIVRVRVTNASKTVSNKCTVIYNVGP